MNKNTKQNNAPAIKTAPIKSEINPPAEKGTKENPWTSDTFPAPDWKNNPGKYANHYFKKGNNDVFQFDKEGKSNQRGNWVGTAHENRGENKGGAARLKRLFLGDITPARLTGETSEDYEARLSRVELGALAIKAIAGQLTVKTAAREAGQITRQKTEAEIDAETLTLDRKGLLAFMANPTNLQTIETVQASEAKIVTLSELTGAEVLESGQEAGLIDFIMQSVRAAIRAA